eukprot:scaffold34921_cov162-Amphora_coffeaeformis.AAC.14
MSEWGWGADESSNINLVGGTKNLLHGGKDSRMEERCLDLVRIDKGTVVFHRTAEHPIEGEEATNLISKPRNRRFHFNGLLPRLRRNSSQRDYNSSSKLQKT